MLAEQPPMGFDEQFEELFLRYYRPVFYLFRRYRFTEEESHELTQETFLRVYKSGGTFRGQATFKTWIYQIARNIALNEIRGRRTSKRGAPEVPFDDAWRPEEDGAMQDSISVAGPGPLDDLLQAEDSRILHEAVESLPPQMQRCVRLRVEQDLKYREIAVVMGISIDTVKAHLFQARILLKDKISEHFLDQDDEE